MTGPNQEQWASCAYDVRAQLGEGPVWIAEEKALYFVDIVNKRVHRFEPGTGKATHFDAPDKVAFLLPLEDGTFLAGVKDGLYRFDSSDGSFRKEVDVEPDLPGNRLNDGCVDIYGRGWFGTMDDSEEAASGSLYSVRHEASGFVLRKHDTGYTVANGPAVSPDGRTLYACDTPSGNIYRFDIAADGNLVNKRVFVHLPEDKGYPDGVVTDCEGNVWSSTWGGGHVRCFTPEGVERFAVRVPATNVTKVAFGGPDRKTAYVTSARQNLSAGTLAGEPHAGSVFTFRSDKAGLPQHRIRLSA
ncbi:SMP-30/gluconolactonase/LRE family protein [Swaminathania salitolerans]|uniref:Gluconolaconase n=1 Tax=Swaminathania salitolerans TaxID=182838 RepID=A0A511BM50_9PROT|nr:SMP-30/gluconolactonase/LRE family protein [Swaminathania salitolerans]GBQ15568.1 transcriptional regulator [Swaminathania salitolerans LMG 21291]GEL01406.1 gluconolaconase [Swaminathania salitolerans]